MKFFESLGFKRAAKSIRQYRNGDTELTRSEPHAVARVAACIIFTTRLSRWTNLVSNFAMHASGTPSLTRP